MTTLLKVENLHVTVGGKEILKGVNLTINAGEVHAIMGPNGSGKSTLAFALMGKPGYEITSGRILYKGEDISALEPEERAQKGIFLGFQYPIAIPGVTVANFLMTALMSLSAVDPRYKEIRKNFRKNLKEYMAELNVDPSFTNRYLNDGFSGGEKKRIEILQLLTLQPTLAILDETDSGLDIDALKVVSEGVNTFTQNNKERAVMVITHYQRILNHLKPQFVHVLARGNILVSGGPELALQLEEKGYQAFGLKDEPQEPAPSAIAKGQALQNELRK